MLKKVGAKYGVKWKNTGCIKSDKHDNHNKKVRELLNVRNGEGWEKEFWNEMSKSINKNQND